MIPFSGVSQIDRSVRPKAGPAVGRTDLSICENPKKGIISNAICIIFFMIYFAFGT